MEGELSPDKLPKSVKVRSTCNACQQAKIRCSHERPSCKRCQKHNIDCVYSISRRLGRPAKKRDPNIDPSMGQGGSDGPSNKRLRGQKKKKVKEEPLPDFDTSEQSVDGESKPLFDTLTFDHGHMDDIPNEDPSLRTPTFMDIVTAAPFSSSSTQNPLMPTVRLTRELRIVSNDIDMASDSWLHEFMSNPFTDPTQSCSFVDPFENDIGVDGTTTRTSTDQDSLPVQSEGLSDSTPEALDLSSSSSYYPALNDCLSHSESVSSASQSCLQGNSVYPESLKHEAFLWSQSLPSLSEPEPSSFFPQANPSKRTQNYSFSGEELATNVGGISSICPCQSHDHTVRDLIRVNACALQTGPTVAIDSILTCQRVLQQLTETILQCRGCSQTRMNFLMVIMFSIDNLLVTLDAITSAENDVVERLFPEYFGTVAQGYRADTGITNHNRRFNLGSVPLRAQLDACPLIIGGFCVPSEEKFAFVKRILHRRLACLQRTVHRIQVYTQEYLAPSAGKVTMMKEIYQRLRLIMVKLNILTRP